MSPFCPRKRIKTGSKQNRLPADPERHRDVVERRELGQEVVKLVDEAERAVAKLAERLLGKPREARARHANLSRIDRVEPAHGVQQGRLARARRAEDRDGLPAGHAEGDVGEDGDGMVAVVIDLDEARDLDGKFLIHSEVPPQAGCGPRASSDRAWPRGSAGRRRARSE